MSENFFQVFTQENSELQKQIGCMSGFFHMFDRLHLGNGRRFNGHQNKRITSGNSIANNSKVGADKYGCSPQVVLESSRTSFSPSSCSSSFSSIDCSKSTPQEPLSFKKDTSSYGSLGDLPKFKVQEIDAPSAPVGIGSGVYNASPEHGQLSLDFRDVVKDSIIREPHGLLVKTSSKGEPKRPELNYMNSPKQMQLSNSMEESYLTGIDGKCKPSLDLNESFRVLMKLKEAPWNFSEVSKPSRPSLEEAKEAPFYRISCDSPRFSYDGREMSQNFADTHENGEPKSKFRDLPRLSLGSRESSMRTSKSPLKDFDGRSIMEWSSSPPFTQKESCIQKSAPNVVAKLMGLETMPALKASTRRQLANMKGDDIKKVSTSTNQRGSSLTSKSLYSSRVELLALSSPRSSHQDLTKLWQKNPIAVMKPSNIPRAPLEPAPWKHEEKLRVTQNKFSNRRSQSKQHPEIVYSETERRLKEVEFHHSNKDLRALKQIMNAMHAKGLLKPKKNGAHSPKIASINSNGHVLAHGIQSPPSVNVCKPALPASAKTSSTTRAAESPIVIMKSAKSINKNDVSTSFIIPLQDLTGGLRKLRTSELMDNKVHGGDSGKLAKDHTPKTSPRIVNKAEDNVQKGRLRTIHASPRPQQLSEGNGSAVKSSKSVSPRLQQTNTEIGVRTRSPVLSSDSTNHQKFSTSKQLFESTSPKNKLSRQANRTRGRDDKLSSSRESWKFIQQRDGIHHTSDSYMSSASQLDVEVTSGNTLAHVNFASFQQGVRSCAIGTPLTLKDSPFSVSAEASTLAMAGEVPEQPSPISVLDATFYHDDLPVSAVKKSSNFSKGENLPNSVDLCESRKIGSGINQKKLETADKLLQKLKELNLTTETASNADHTALPCESPKTDHRYILEILLASGLLMKDLTAAPKGLMSFKIHPSSYPINPDLFLVLEQTKTSEPVKYENITGRKQLQHNLDVDKMHRKLVFDVINEVLIEKLELTSSSFRPSLSPRAMKLKGKLPSGQLLLKELCSEIDRLHAEGLKAESWDDEDKLTVVLRDSVGWNDHRIELPGIVLDVERWIFKDLIDDVLSGEICGVHHSCSRRRRQLFAK